MVSSRRLTIHKYLLMCILSCAYSCSHEIQLISHFHSCSIKNGINIINILQWFIHVTQLIKTHNTPEPLLHSGRLSPKRPTIPMQQWASQNLCSTVTMYIGKSSSLKALLQLGMLLCSSHTSHSPVIGPNKPNRGHLYQSEEKSNKHSMTIQGTITPKVHRYNKPSRLTAWKVLWKCSCATCWATLLLVSFFVIKRHESQGAPVLKRTLMPFFSCTSHAGSFNAHKKS